MDFEVADNIEILGQKQPHSASFPEPEYLFRAAWAIIAAAGLVLSIMLILRSGHGGDDSWLPMARALDFLRQSTSDLVYQALFFGEKIKFQYPPSSLLVIDLLSHVGITTPAQYNTINAVVLIVSALVFAQFASRVLGHVSLFGVRVPIAPIAFLIALRYFPNQVAFELGQIQIWIWLFFILSCLLLWQGRPFVSGLLIGASALIKPQFCLFGALALWRRNCGASSPPALWSWSLPSCCRHGSTAGGAQFDYLSVLSFLSRHGEYHHLNQSIGGRAGPPFLRRAAARPGRRGRGDPRLRRVVPALSPRRLRSDDGDQPRDDRGGVFAARDGRRKDRAFARVHASRRCCSPWRLRSPGVHHYNVLLPAYVIALKGALDRQSQGQFWLAAVLLAISYGLTGFRLAPPYAPTEAGLQPRPVACPDRRLDPVGRADCTIPISTEGAMTLLDNADIDKPLDKPEPIPLVVDLDGTLIRTDLLYESYFASATLGVRHHWATMRALARGKAPLKAFLAEAGPVDYAVLPYNEDVLTIIRAAKAQGRKVYLATASDERHCRGRSQPSRPVRRRVLLRRPRPICRRARRPACWLESSAAGISIISATVPRTSRCGNRRGRPYIVAPSGRLVRRVERMGVETEHAATTAPTLRTWLKALRVHQYSKNTLIFVPLLTAHVFDASSIARALLAFIAFSLCASSAYLINDLIDPRFRPQASEQEQARLRLGRDPGGAGRRRHSASSALGVWRSARDVAAVLRCAARLSRVDTGLLLHAQAQADRRYRRAGDAVHHARHRPARLRFRSSRRRGGLLAFSMFIFTCLALVKRYTELAMRIDRELPDPSNRNYRLVDLPIVGALAAASGLNAVTIFALYVSSPEVRIIYHRPEILWLICPILLYWLSRIVILAHRRAVDDDPIVFALHDRNSLVCGVAAVCVLALASWM